MRHEHLDNLLWEENDYLAEAEEMVMRPSHYLRLTLNLQLRVVSSSFQWFSFE